ncbi:MAG: DsrE family protein [Pseudomonadota bacterium]|nr:DsrE family protein [Pseudomonadota bacterium]
MKLLNRSGAACLLSIVLGFGFGPSRAADSSPEPYGSAKFSPYGDINSLKQLKSVWDWSFEDPAQADVSMNFIGALLRATQEFGPTEIDPIKTVVVSHGPEVVIWAKKNYGKYKKIVDRAASLSQQGVRFEICRNDAAALGFKPEDLHGFVHVIPAGPYALVYWQNKGYAYVAGGSSKAVKPVTEFNKMDLGDQK